MNETRDNPKPLLSDAKRLWNPGSVEAAENEALQTLAASRMSEVEIAEKVLQMRGVNKTIADAISCAKGKRSLNHY